MIALSAEAKELIAREICNSKINNKWVETGGAIFIDASKLQVTDVSGPGPKAIRNANDIVLDPDYLTKVIKEHYGSGSVFQGTWHSHIGPNSITTPSIEDLAYFKQLSRKFKMNLYFLIIAANPSNFTKEESYFPREWAIYIYDHALNSLSLVHQEQW